MTNYIILYNAFSNNGNSKEGLKTLESLLPGSKLTYQDITKIKDYKEFFGNLANDERIIIYGGDGTLNHFVNDIQGVDIDREIYCCAAGTGNDFLRDIDVKPGDKPVLINPYIENLPTVTVNGKNYKFINGVGYGIDGYCCEVGDELRAKSVKKINYTSIAIKGLLFHYKPTNAKIIVDGVVHEYKKAWLAPTMNGRFYGGGMMAAPDQNRLNKDKTLSVMVFYGKGRLKTLMTFPSIFKGEHVKHNDMVEILVGKDITVEFDTPTALQIDGETIKGVTKYHATSSFLQSNKKEKTSSAATV